MHHKSITTFHELYCACVSNTKWSIPLISNIILWHCLHRTASMNECHWTDILLLSRQWILPLYIIAFIKCCSILRHRECLYSGTCYWLQNQHPVHFTIIFKERKMQTRLLNPSYSDDMMNTMASQIIGVSIVCSAVFLSMRRSKKIPKLRVTGLCEGNSSVNSTHKGPVTRKLF